MTGIIYQIFEPYANIYTIAKANAIGDKEDKNMISQFMGLFRSPLYNFFKLIPYTRNDKESGIIVKNQMNMIKNNRH